MKPFPGSDTPARVLVTGARSPAAPDVVRYLSGHGHRVTVSDSLFFPLARGCRDAAGYLRYPPARTNFAAFSHWMTCAATAFDWIWPCCEEVFWLAKIPGLPLFAPRFERLHQVHRKDRLVDLVNGLVPDVSAPSSRAFGGGDLPADHVAKPVYGRFGHRTVIGPASLPVTGPGEAWIQQALIRGSERCLHLIAHAGHLIERVVYRDPHRTGTRPCYAFTRDSNEALNAFAHRFCESTRWTGQIGFDIITDLQGHHWVIDANPRATSGMHLIQRPGSSMVALPGIHRLNRGMSRAPRPTNALTAPGDNGPAWLAPLTSLELIARHGWPLEHAATADLQWP